MVIKNGYILKISKDHNWWVYSYYYSMLHEFYQVRCNFGIMEKLIIKKIKRCK